MIEISSILSIMIYNEIKQEFKFARKFITFRRITFLFISYIYIYIYKYKIHFNSLKRFYKI